jgi:PilZ domain
MGNPTGENGNERREDERSSVSLEAWWEGLSGRYTARVSDLSMGGCYVESPGHVQLGELVVFAIMRPDGRWLPLRGRVITSEPEIGFSVSFTYLTDEEQQELKRLGAI